MKILIATDTYYPHVNGCSYFSQRLAFYLQKKGNQVLVIAPSKSVRSEFYAHQGVSLFWVRSIPLYYNNFTFTPPFFIREIVKKTMIDFAPDVVHLQGHFFISKTVLEVAEELGIPVVGTNHFMPENLVHYLHLPAKLEKYVMEKAWNQFREVFERLHTVTSPTQTAADLVHKLNFSKKVLPVSNGIDRERFHPRNDGTYLRKKYSIPERPAMLYVGRLDKEKNIDLVLRSFAKAAKNLDIHFIIAGSGVVKNTLEKLAVELGVQDKVTFTGFVPDEDLPNLYRIVDVFVNAGIAELQSIVTMEAMASGLPVIAVNAVALPELVKHGENGFLFEADDEKTLSENIRAIFSDEDLRKKMAQRSLEIIEKHDINNTIQQFEDIYLSAIQK